MIKVMHVIHGLNMGGAETLVKEYALKLDKSKFDLQILCFNHFNDSPYEEQLKNSNIKVLYVEDYQKYYNKRGLTYKIFNHYQRYFLIKKMIHKYNPDVLHTHLTINKFIKFASPKKGTKIFHTVHSEPKRYWPNKKNKDYKAAKFLVKKYGMRFICLHDKMRMEINQIFNVNNSLILNNGIDLKRFKNVVNKEKMRESLNIANNSLVIGNVGRFSKVKNHDFIIEVFNEIYKQNKNSFLLLIGSGEEKENIISKINMYKLNNNCLLLENRTDVPDLLNAMDIFLFPSICEGLGIAVIEAQNASLPCFISNGVPSSAIISNLVTKIDLNDSYEFWANQILNYEKPQQIIINNEDWDIDKIVKKLESIYEYE